MCKATFVKNAELKLLIPLTFISCMFIIRMGKKQTIGNLIFNVFVLLVMRR
jgi:hypothetical protein